MWPDSNVRVRVATAGPSFGVSNCSASPATVSAPNAERERSSDATAAMKSRRCMESVLFGWFAPVTVRKARLFPARALQPPAVHVLQHLINGEQPLLAARVAEHGVVPALHRDRRQHFAADLQALAAAELAKDSFIRGTRQPRRRRGRRSGAPLLGGSTLQSRRKRDALAPVAPFAAPGR